MTASTFRERRLALRRAALPTVAVPMLDSREWPCPKGGFLRAVVGGRTTQGSEGSKGLGAPAKMFIKLEEGGIAGRDGPGIAKVGIFSLVALG